MSVNTIAKDIAKAITQKKTKPQGYDTKGTVISVSGNTAWVHLNGGVDETPVELTMNASAGDTVQVRVSGGDAWITGNTTEPPTGGKTVQNIINKEKKNIIKTVEEETINIIQQDIHNIGENYEIEPYNGEKLFFSAEDLERGRTVNGFRCSKFELYVDKNKGEGMCYVLKSKNLLAKGAYFSDVKVIAKGSNDIELTLSKISANYDIYALMDKGADIIGYWNNRRIYLFSTEASALERSDYAGMFCKPSYYDDWNAIGGCTYGTWPPYTKNAGGTGGTVSGWAYNRYDVINADASIMHDPSNSWNYSLEICIKLSALPNDFTGIEFRYEVA